jgi:PAS domain S-box-containing protein
MMSTGNSPADQADLDRLDFVLGLGNLAWWEIDCATGAVRFHRRKAEMLGYEPEIFTHYSDFTALLHPDDLELAMRAMRDHLEGVQPEYQLDYRIRDKAGAYRWFHDVGRVSRRDENGRPVVVTGVVLDITARKQVEDGLRESEQRFSRLFHGHAAIKLVIAPDTGSIVDANEAAARFYGWSVDELRQMRIQQINELPPDELKTKMAVAASSPNAQFEFRHRRADGSTRDVEVFSNKIEIGGRIVLYSIIHDICGRKEAEEALRKAHDRLHHAETVARFGHWELSLDDSVMHASDGAIRIYGLSANRVSLSEVKRCALPEYRPLLNEALRKLIEDNTPYGQDFVIRRASDGELVAVHSRAEYDPVRRVVFGVVQDISERKRIETEREALILELKAAADDIRTLSGILPICANCKKIRDDKGYWEQVEAYVSRHTDARFSHGICPDCMSHMYPDYLEG